MDGRQEALFSSALRSEAGRTVWGWTLCLNALLGNLTLTPPGQEGAMKQGREISFALLQTVMSDLGSLADLTTHTALARLPVFLQEASLVRHLVPVG